MGIKIEGWKILKGNENAKNVLNVLNILRTHRAEWNMIKMIILKDAHPVNFISSSPHHENLLELFKWVSINPFRWETIANSMRDDYIKRVFFIEMEKISFYCVYNFKRHIFLLSFIVGIMWITFYGIETSIMSIQHT